MNVNKQDEKTWTVKKLLVILDEVSISHSACMARSIEATLSANDAPSLKRHTYKIKKIHSGNNTRQNVERCTFSNITD